MRVAIGWLCLFVLVALAFSLFALLAWLVATTLFMSFDWSKSMIVIMEVL